MGRKPYPRAFAAPSRLAALFLFVVALVGLSPALRAAEQLYTCSMHPQIIRREPGNCPICGMPLTPLRKQPAGATEAGRIAIDPLFTQRMNLRTAPVERGPVVRTIRAVGTVEFDERGLRDITTRFEGWIEKLFVDATWTRVEAGQPLFEIYSPDLFNAQLNFLVARRSEPGRDGPLTQAAASRLQLYGVPEDFIASLARSGQPQRTFTFRAPAGGVVIEKAAVAGQMVKAGELIYRLADLSTVWVLAQIYEGDLPFVREGQPAEVRLSFGDEREFRGNVERVIPQVTEATRTATARIVLDNPDGFLRPGMFAAVRLRAQLAEAAVLVPDSAILRSGEQDTVFVALGDGHFEPRAVELGPRSENDRYQVLSGVSPGERIVVSGQFMLDSESRLKQALEQMVPGENGSPEASPAPASDGR